MAAPSTASRPRTRDVADSDDIVAARALQFAEWARRNARWILIGGVVALLLGAGLFYYRVDRAQRAERAAAQFATVSTTAASGNTALAVRDLQAFIGRFGGTTEADEARILLARIHLESGQAARAIPVLQGFASNIGDSPLHTSGALLLGAAQAEAGQRDAAIATYLRVADGATTDFLKEEALAEAATLREIAGNYAGAAELYSRLAALAEEGSLDRSVYEMRVAEAEARAQAGPAAATPAGQ